MSGVRGRSSRWLDSLAADGSGVKEQQALERAIRSALATLQDNIQQLQQQAAELAEDERALEAKLSKKKAELERNEKRLASLQGVRLVPLSWTRNGQDLSLITLISTTAGRLSWRSMSVWRRSLRQSMSCM